MGRTLSKETHMSKTEDAQALVALGTDGARPAAERLSALEAANGMRRELKVGWAKLGAPEGFNFGAELEDLRAAAASEAQDLGDTEKPQADDDSSDQVIDPQVGDEELPKADEDGASGPSPRPDRGGIGRLVNLLLTTTDDDYKTIVAKVKAAHPEAKTTARSVASVAADLRRAGADVPTRRRAKAA